MKKMYLSFAAVILVSVSSMLHAQGVGLGIKGGANFADQSITDVSSDSRTGFHAGIYIKIAFSDKFGIQPEVLFSTQGSELPDGINDFSYVNIPVLLSWKPISLLSFEAGPQFGTLLEAVIDDEDYSDDFKKADVGLALGATVHLPLGFNVGARYIWGFTDIADPSDEFKYEFGVDDDFEVKNSNFQVFVGWTIFGAK